MIGADITGLTIARAVAGHGVPVVAVDKVRHRYAGYSGAFDLVLRDDFDDPDFIGYLERLADDLPRRAVLFLSMDRHVLQVCSTGLHLRQRYHFLFPEHTAVEVLLDKARFAERATREGWPIPPTVTVREPGGLAAAADALTFPVIVKPAVKHVPYTLAAPAKAFRCADARSLRAAYDVVARWEAEVVVQEWIPGGDDRMWYSFHYHDRDLREVSAFEGRKIRQWVPEVGSTSLAVGVAVPEVTPLSRAILRTAGCVGFGAVEYKRDARTDRFLITEPTVGRCNLQCGVALANGVDFISRAYFHLVGRSYPGVDTPTHDRKWVILDSDFRAARHLVRQGTLTWGGYLASLRGPLTLSVWRLGDVSLHLRALANLLGAPWRLARRALGALLPPRPPRPPRAP